MMGDRFDRGVVFRADNDHVDHLAQHAGKVGNALAFAETSVLAEHDAAAAQVRDAGFKTDPRPQRLLLEQQGQRPAREQRFAQALRVLRLQILGDRENPRDFGGGDVAKSNQVAHGTIRRRWSVVCRITLVGTTDDGSLIKLLRCVGSEHVGENFAALVEFPVAERHGREEPDDRALCAVHQEAAFQTAFDDGSAVDG